ncbi:hypothetical protein Scep_011680 [Stephania cephalantha]|uniref:Uncharacterized protein n=1 Tax=Stephania cephalantha TaxID=152367 RepID=A0AAP0JFT0_9MAGN
MCAKDLSLIKKRIAKLAFNNMNLECVQDANKADKPSCQLMTARLLPPPGTESTSPK